MLLHRMFPHRSASVVWVWWADSCFHHILHLTSSAESWKWILLLLLPLLLWILTSSIPLLSYCLHRLFPQAVKWNKWIYHKTMFTFSKQIQKRAANIPATVGVVSHVMTTLQNVWYPWKKLYFSIELCNYLHLPSKGLNLSKKGELSGIIWSHSSTQKINSYGAIYIFASLEYVPCFLISQASYPRLYQWVSP